MQRNAGKPNTYYVRLRHALKIHDQASFAQHFF